MPASVSGGGRRTAAAPWFHRPGQACSAGDHRRDTEHRIPRARRPGDGSLAGPALEQTLSTCIPCWSPD